MIELIVQRVIEAIPPSSGDDFLGFYYDVEHYFVDSNSAFVHATAAVRDDNSCLLEMRGDIAPHISSLQEISGELHDLWRTLAYPHFQASSCKWYQEATVLRFVTVIHDDLFYVTGKVMVGGGHYAELIKKFERDYRMKIPSLSDPLPSRATN
jgi:hypothetical protein